MIEIEQLTVLHETLRSPARMPVMVQHARTGGLWTREAPQLAPRSDKAWMPIGIARFPDGFLLLHDGHHRTTATYLAGRDHLHTSEYEIKDYTYGDFLNPNLKVGWYTPLDPKMESRMADFMPFKKQVTALAAQDPATAIAFIKQNRDRYACWRTIRRVSELARRAGLTG